MKSASVLSFRSAIAGLIALLLVVGCAPKIRITNLEHSYSTGFRTMPIPTEDEIKRRGASRDLPAYTQSEIWNAGISVVMQRGPIVQAEEAKRIIIAPPYALLLENREQRVVLHCAFMDELYYNSKNPKQEVFRITPDEKRRFVEEVLDRVVTQASVHRNLGPTGKWKYIPE